MLSKSIRILSILALALLSVQIAFAKAISEISLSGPFLNGEVGIKNKEDFDTILDFITHAHFAPDLTDPVVGADSYLIKLGISDAEGTMVAATIIGYFPGLNGQPGLLHYEDVISGTSSAEGNWFRVDPEREFAFRKVLNSFGIGFGQDGTAQYSQSYVLMAELAALDQPREVHIAVPAQDAGRIIFQREVQSSEPQIESSSSESPVLPDLTGMAFSVVTLCLIVFALSAIRSARKPAAM